MAERWKIGVRHENNRGDFFHSILLKPWSTDCFLYNNRKENYFLISQYKSQLQRSFVSTKR